MKKIIPIALSFLLNACSTTEYVTEEYVDLDKFVTDWYVIAGRFTAFEDGAHNPIEKYSWSENKEHIQVKFTFNQDSFDGVVKHIAQKAWVYNKNTNAHWKIRPFWPLKLNYLILAVAEDYSWTAVGVPNQKYLWIMAKEKTLSEKTMQEILSKLEQINYSTAELEYAKHQR